MSRRKYLKRASEIIIAVQVALETEGFTYFKWGATQSCKRGDWLVNNNGDVCTIDDEPGGGDAYAVSKDTFERMYAPAD